MPRYHFDLIGKQTIIDQSGLDLADDILAADAADRIANELYSVRPELRHQLNSGDRRGRRGNLSLADLEPGSGLGNPGFPIFAPSSAAALRA
jgi:hypothetical protein